MPINYKPVVWDTTKYVNPTNMNQMDNGIKAACDAADELEQEVEAVNESLENKMYAPNKIDRIVSFDITADTITELGKQVGDLISENNLGTGQTVIACGVWTGVDYVTMICTNTGYRLSIFAYLQSTAKEYHLSYNSSSKTCGILRDFQAEHDALNSNLDRQWVKLWNNSDITSAFTSQNISVNLTSYTVVAIEYTPIKNIYRGMISLVMVGKTIPLYAFAYNSGVLQLRSRECTVYADRVAFLGGALNGADNNDVCIPTAIYGVK